MSSARSHSRGKGAAVPAYDPIFAESTKPRYRLSELAYSREAAVGRAHRAPCAQHIVERDDSRRRATPSTLAASLLRRGGIASLSASSSWVPLNFVGQFFTMLPSVLQHSCLISLGLYIPAIEDRSTSRLSHVGGLVEIELQARVVQGRRDARAALPPQDRFDRC